MSDETRERIFTAKRAMKLVRNSLGKTAEMYGEASPCAILRAVTGNVQPSGRKAGTTSPSVPRRMGGISREEAAIRWLAADDARGERLTMRLPTGTRLTYLKPWSRFSYR